MLDIIPELESKRRQLAELNLDQIGILDRTMKHAYIDAKGNLRRSFDEDEKFCYFAWNIIIRKQLA